MADRDRGLMIENLGALSAIERAGSAISLVGSLFVIGTYCASKEFRKPINRLVFYASFGNLLTTVGTLMATSFVDDPLSPACQFQGFLIQAFMPADAFWTLAMAINVYLTFYHKYDAERLRQRETMYFVFCYGLPFVLGIAYIFIETEKRGRIFGDATLWCWVTPKWDFLRIATFYGPIWGIMVITFIIYIRAGCTIYNKRNQLRKINKDAELASMNGDGIATYKVTEVMVTSEVLNDPTAILGISSPSNIAATGAYSVHISSNNNRPDASRPHTSATSISPSAFSRPHSGTRPTQDLSNAAWSYTKCAILFFSAIMITWIPSSANRVYSVIHNGYRFLPLEYMSALVLPLQGFWNAVIYCVTSWAAVKLLYADVRAKITGAPPRPGANADAYPSPTFRGHRDSARPPPARGFKSESSTELAPSQTSSNEHIMSS